VTLGFGRVVPSAGATAAERLALPAGETLVPRGHVVPKPVVDAHADAAAIMAAAEERARELVLGARAALATEREAALTEARAEGAAALAEHALRLAALEESAEQRGLDRVVELARVLAERLLGESLALDPTRVVALAQQALKEARGARQITLVAHPDDAAELERALGAGSLEHVTCVLADASQGRGSLRLESEIGTLDADLAPQLTRLARRLREALNHEP
jgi:flagellar biosynthesis/type III secretory pathway protein FliH